MGKSEKRELINRLSVLLVHLLKWLFQLEFHSNSWKYPIEEPRRAVTDLLEDNPSLRYELEDKLEKAYASARLQAARRAWTKRVFQNSVLFR